MGVITTKRTESKLEFYHTATIVRTEVTRFVMSEKNVPKRWRQVFTFPMIEKTNGLIDNISAANTIYPTTIYELERRRAYQTEALICIEQLLQYLQFMLETLNINADRIQRLTELLMKEDELLRKWRESDKKRIKAIEKNEAKQIPLRLYDMLAVLYNSLADVQNIIGTSIHTHDTEAADVDIDETID